MDKSVRKVYGFVNVAVLMTSQMKQNTTTGEVVRKQSEENTTTGEALHN